MPVLRLQDCHSSICPVLTLAQWGSETPRHAIPRETRTGEFPQLFPSSGLCMSTSSSPEDSRVGVLPPWPLLSPYHTVVTVISQYNHILGSGEVLQRSMSWVTNTTQVREWKPAVSVGARMVFCLFLFFEAGLCQAQASLLPQQRAGTTGWCYYTQLSKYLTAYLHMVQNEYFTECLWTLKSYHC